MSFAAYIPVGVADGDHDRVVDLIDSVIAHSMQLAWVVLIEDSAIDRDLSNTLPVPDGCSLIVIRNPRKGIGCGPTGGLCVADLVAMEYIQKNTDAEFILKLDCDSLIVGPFEEGVLRAMHLYKDAGMFGVIGDTPELHRSYRCIEENRRLLETVVQLSDDFSSLTADEVRMIRSWGFATDLELSKLTKARRILQRAIKNGYQLGQYCQGGGYVVTRSVIDSMAATSQFADHLIWSEINIGEDVMMAIQCVAAGFRMYDLSGPDGGFNVYSSTLPLTPDEVATMNTSVIHSIKGPMEGEFRAFFRQRRFHARRRACTPPSNTHT